MTPLEELQAAHERLTTLRGGGAPSPWHVGESDPAPGWEMNRAVDCAGDGAVTDYIDVVDAELIVTLHRTIDAQLATLQWWIDWHAMSPQAVDPDPYVINLAKAINGGSNDGA